jgi:Rrf2 family protein
MKLKWLHFGVNMAANTRFAVAIHAAGMLAFGDRVLVTSESIAKSVHTNPVVVRRILGLLTRHGLVEVQMGACGGSRLSRPPKEISLFDIYQAIESGSLFQVPLLEDHKCIVGRTVRPVIQEVLQKTENVFLAKLKEITLADVIELVHSRLPNCKS